MKIKNLIRSENGSSSILVIILMVVMMVFGLAVLTTSLSNLRLAEKKQAWETDYYTLEGAVMEEIATIDQLLLKAEAEALSYIESTSYVSDYPADNEHVQEIASAVFKLTYMDSLQKLISQHIKGEKTSALYLNNYNLESILDGKIIQPSILEFDTSLPEGNYPKHITVQLSLLAPNSDNQQDNYTLLNRYTITKFVEWQDAFEYDDAIDFEDLFDELDESIDENNGDFFSE